MMFAKTKFKGQTRHVHESYRNHLSQFPNPFYIPMKPWYTEGCNDRPADRNWPTNMCESPRDGVHVLYFFAIRLCSPSLYGINPYKILIKKARKCEHLSKCNGFEYVRTCVSLDIVGMDLDVLNGLGKTPDKKLLDCCAN